MMKHISGIFVLVISTFMLHAQNPTWSWAKNNGGGANDYSYGTATDTFGNVYYCGNFYSNNAKFGTTTIPSSGLGDGFLCKYDANGNFLWVKTFGGTDVETCKKVAVSPHGDVFVIGYSEGNFNVDSNAYSSYGEADCFVAKYTTDGKLKWCNHFGGPYDDYCYGLAVDSKGRCIVTGHFERTMTVGNVTLTSQNDSLYDGFIVKFDKSGNVLWATSAGGSIRGAYVFPNDVAIDASGNVFVTGLYSGPVNFGSTTFYSVDEAFISKLSNNGSWKWTVDAGSHCYYTYIALDNATDIYIVGSFGAYGFNSVIQGNTLVPNGPYLDIYLAKFNSSGLVQSIVTGGSNQNDYSGGVVVDGAGNAWISGYITGGTGTFGSKSFTSAGSYDMFVTSYDASLNVKWLAHAGGSDVDEAYDLSYNGKSKLYVAGYFKSQTKFGSITLNASSPSADACLAALDITGLKTETSVENVSGISVFPNPVNDVLTLKLQGAQATSLEVFDAEGKLKMSKVITTNTEATTLDISSLPPGVYFLQMKTEAGSSTTKFLKQ